MRRKRKRWRRSRRPAGKSRTELRRLLGVLRDGQHTELSPPQLAYLDDLIDQFRAAGLSTFWDVLRRDERRSLQ